MTKDNLGKENGDKNEPWLGLAQYHSNETEAMLQRYRQVENLIGLGHHSPSEGDWCEDLLRGFLRDTLPKRFSIDTGFILGTPTSIPWFPNDSMPTETVRVTPQLDVIIHDTENYSPVLRTGEFVVVLPDSVHGVIEVKKTLSSENLKRAVQVLATTRWLVHCWRGPTKPGLIFTSVFSFGASDDLKPQNRGISDSYENRYQEICRSYGPAYAIPDLLAVANDKFLAVTNENSPVRVMWGPTLHEGVNISGQLLLWHLMKSGKMHEMSARIGRFQWPENLPIGGEFEFSHPDNPFGSPIGDVEEASEGPISNSSDLMLPQAEPVSASCISPSCSDSHDPESEPATPDRSGCPSRTGGPSCDATDADGS